MINMTDQNVREYTKKLDQLEFTYKTLEHPELKAITDVQNFLGYGLDESLATLIMKTEKGFVAIIRRGDCKLDNKKVKKILGVNSLRIATGDEFTRLTGVVIGAAHILHPVDRTIIDRRVFEKGEINGGSGSLTVTIRYRSEDLKKIPHSEVVDIAETAVATAGTGTEKKRVFSGIRATGILHLGNYLGAIKGMIELQNNPSYETVFMVVDVHSITTPFIPKELRYHKRNIFIDYLAAGLDPEKSILTYQSLVPEHTELAFYFSSVMSIARMQHLPTFKDKIKQHPQHSMMALLNYPILMAADILVYKAGFVPVGIDQEPHLEVAREVARKMNEQYGMDFPEPVRFATKGAYIPSLKGEGKMSKSVEGSYINLTDSEDEVQKKVRSIPTATEAGGVMNNGVKTLFTYADLYIPDTVSEYKKQYEAGTLKFVELKDAIADRISKELRPFQEKRKEIEKDQAYIDKALISGAERARSIAHKTVAEVTDKMGLC